MNAQHTPGPWVAKTYSSEFVSGQIPIYGNSDSIVVSDVGGRSVDQINANIRLISAAPDLLDALEWWVAQMQNDSCDDMGKLLDDMTDKARAAIAKAEGR